MNLKMQLRKLRAEHGLYASQLAELAGVSSWTAYKFENGTANTTLANVEAMFGALGYELVPVKKENK